jgi:hypothetical protein
MERLTERSDDDPKGVWVKDHDYVTAAYRLAEYEDTGLTPEEIKLLLKPPEYIYIVENDDGKAEVRQLVVDEEGCYTCAGPYTHFNCDYDGEYYEIPVLGLGKDYFLDANKAEEKLRKAEPGKDE